MVNAATVQWVGTVVFAITGAFYLRAVLLRQGAWHRGAVLDDALHVLLCAAMIVMLWPWGMGIPTMVYVLAFTAATLWFVARALRIVAAGPRGAADPPAPQGNGALAWYHAAMMAAMVWMAVVMGVAMTTLTAGADITTAVSGLGMAGMDMGGGPSPVSGPVPPTVLGGGTRLVWISVPCLVLAAEFLIAAVWQGAVAVRDGRRPAVLAGGVGTVMAGGMALVFVALA